MNALHPLDWLVLAVCLIALVTLGLYMGKKAKGNLEGFFLGGRNLPFWLAGLSMVATTFAADTPLAVTEMVAEHGISGNWMWWNFLAGGMLTAVVFAPLWRRSGVVTEAELIELRYDGHAAKWLRVFRAGYLGLFINVLILGWVHLAMVTVLEGMFGLTQTINILGFPIASSLLIAGGITLIVAFYAMVSGLLGIVVTDAVQFVLAMVGSIALAVFVIQSPEVGGLDGLTQFLPEEKLDFFPSLGSGDGSDFAMPLASFLAFFGMMWWSVWYPGAEPGGGGYIAQRMLSTKSEADATGATLLFQFAHYAIRPWPWILVALSVGMLFQLPDKVSPELQEGIARIESMEGFESGWLSGESSPSNTDDAMDVMVVREGLRQAALSDVDIAQALHVQREPRFGYIYAMKNHLPAGWLGLMLVAFFSAYMSTLSTQLNWGASYLVNDIWLRLRQKERPDKRIMQVSRFLVIALALISLAVSTQMDSIKGVWQFIMECGAGLGLVLILRWFWGRINAWVEIAATTAPFLGYYLAHYQLEWVFPNAFFFTVAFTTGIWLLVLLLTKPSKAWPHFKATVFREDSPSIRSLLLRWLLAIVAGYSLLFFIGAALLHPGWEWILWLIAFVSSSVGLWYLYVMHPKKNQVAKADVT